MGTIASLKLSLSKTLLSLSLAFCLSLYCTDFDNAEIDAGLERMELVNRQSWTDTQLQGCSFTV